MDSGTLQFVSNLSSTAILAVVVYLIARLFEPLVRELIEARKAAVKAREEANALTLRVADRFEASDEVTKAVAASMDKVAQRLDASDRSFQQGVQDTQTKLNSLPQAIAQSTVEKVGEAMDGRLKPVNQRLDAIEKLLHEVRDMLSQGMDQDDEDDVALPEMQAPVPDLPALPESVLEERSSHDDATAEPGG